MPEEQAQAARELMKEPFVTEGYSEADQMAIEKLKSNANIAKLVASSDAQPISVEYNGASFRVVPFITRIIRHKLQSLNIVTTKSDVTMEEAENALYDSLAVLCVDEPYNTRVAWRYIEDQGGNLPGILSAVMEAIKAHTGAVKDFRRKQ